MQYFLPFLGPCVRTEYDCLLEECNRSDITCYEKYECADKHADYGLEKTDIHPNYRNRSEVSFDKCIILKTLYNLYHID